MSSKNILMWNVWGLNARTQRNALHELVIAECPSIIYIQETKLDVTHDFDVLQMICSGYDFFCLPAVQSRGGGGYFGRVAHGHFGSIPLQCIGLLDLGKVFAPWWG
jgi:exonuclease III